MEPSEAFPALQDEGYVKTSDASQRYNCIAWAAGDDQFIWWPDRMGQLYWPEAAPRKATLHAFVRMFQSLGYEQCKTAGAEDGMEKVAIYVKGYQPTHAARQLPTGEWTSKLGSWIDITHTLKGLEGPEYGKVAEIMSRHLE